MLTLSCVVESAIRVCVVPKRLREDAGENALCTPLVVTGTPGELDSGGFAAQLSQYAGSLTKLGSNLSAIEAAHTAAVKAIEEEKKKDLERKRGKPSGSRAPTGTAEPNPVPAMKDGKPIFGTKNASGSTAPLTLFDAPPQEVAPGQHSGYIDSGACTRPNNERVRKPITGGFWALMQLRSFRPGSWGLPPAFVSGLRFAQRMLHAIKKTDSRLGRARIAGRR